MGELWLIALGIVSLSNYCGNRVRSVSVVVVDNFELKLYRETSINSESMVKRISFALNHSVHDTTRSQKRHTLLDLLEGMI
jgi:hypothetical protein